MILDDTCVYIRMSNSFDSDVVILHLDLIVILEIFIIHSSLKLLEISRMP